MLSASFGFLPSGESIEAYTLTNAKGAAVQVTTYGGIVTSMLMPDRHGKFEDVVLGFATLDGYLAGHPYFGAITGRIAGRVEAGRTNVQDRTYALGCNDGTNHLHGGHVGFDKRVWRARWLTPTDGSTSLQLTYRSPDGEEGYPGNVDIAVTYTLTAANAFIVATEARADRVTPLCLAHHSYYNLAGEGSGSIADHELEIAAETTVPTDHTQSLSGRREPVAGRAADFTRARRLGDALPQLTGAHGDFYLLRGADEPPPSPPRRVARVVEPHSGRVLEVFTDESCLQFYTGAALDNTLTGKSGRKYGPHAGLCLECQGYPNGTVQPGFGDILVKPDQPQRRTTIYAFSTI